MKKRRRYFSREFKLQAVRMAEERSNRSEVAQELDLRYELLNRWVKEFNSKKDKAFMNTKPSTPKDPNLQEIQKLKRELRAVKEERDILKKAISIFSKSDSNATNS